MKDTGGPDHLEKIFLFAGRREPVDPKRAERAEQSTRKRWQMMLARRRAAQRHRIASLIGGGVAVAASVVAAVVIFTLRPGTEAPVVATVVNVLGTPETGARGHAMTTLLAGVALRAGSVLETAGADGAALRLASGHSLRLGEATRVRVEADSVVLDAGAVYLDSGGDGRATPIELRSRVATVSELGTQYMVRLVGNALEVSVREGAVRVAQGSSTNTARAGERLQLDESGHTQKSPVSGHGEHWAWVTRLASTPELEGLTLAEFLHWLTREQGWRLAYASSELARDAGSVELYGSIDGLSGEEALDAVMMSTGWRYRLEDGALTIDTPRDQRQ